jgi:YHS domain-containing protein
VIRVILLVILCYILYRLVKSFLLPSSQKFGKQAGPGKKIITDEMVSDPYCNVYIPKHDAIKTKIAGKTFYFCSKECKKKYLEEHYKGQ